MVQRFTEIPFSKAMLDSCGDTHILVPVFSQSILELRDEARSRGVGFPQDWYDSMDFVNKTDDDGWWLVRRTSVANSTDKALYEQQGLLSPNERVPSARVMVHAIILHYLSTGESLFEKECVRTSSVDSSGLGVGVGYFDIKKAGLIITHFRSNERLKSLGLASCMV